MSVKTTGSSRDFVWTELIMYVIEFVDWFVMAILEDRSLRIVRVVVHMMSFGRLLWLNELVHVFGDGIEMIFLQ